MFSKFYYYTVNTRFLKHKNNLTHDVQVDPDYFVQVDNARTLFRYVITKKNYALIMIRLAFVDASSYVNNVNHSIGGPNYTIRDDLLGGYDLQQAMQLCGGVKRKFQKLSNADIIQLAGVVAVEVAGGPTIPFTPGRIDENFYVGDSRHVTTTPTDDSQLLHKFKRMGLLTREIVLFSDIHLLGRERSSCKGGILFNDESWRFDNSYFVDLSNQRVENNVLMLEGSKFRSDVEYYAQNRDEFFKDYATAHKKLSELGYVEFVKENVKRNVLSTIAMIFIFVGCFMIRAFIVNHY